MAANEAGRALPHPEAHPACLGQRDGFDAPDDFDVLPGGVEAIQPLMARGGDIDVKALRAKFGVRVVGPPLLGG